MKKIVDQTNKGKLEISFLKQKNAVLIQTDKLGCAYLIEELTSYLEDNEDVFIDYDSGTGYDCGILTKDSLGIMFCVKS